MKQTVKLLDSSRISLDGIVIDIHLNENISKWLPAISIKSYNWGPSLRDIQEHFKVDEDMAQKIYAKAWTNMISCFRTEAAEIAKTHLGASWNHVHFFGRSDGWLGVEFAGNGNYDYMYWNKKQFRRWKVFAYHIENLLRQYNDDNVIIAYMQFMLDDQWFDPIE